MIHFSCSSCQHYPRPLVSVKVRKVLTKDYWQQLKAVLEGGK
jgi:hypothetical protein